MSFSKIIGQDRAIEILKREISHGRISHAYLFSGMEGIGKKLTALALAMAVQCIEEKTDACSICPACCKILQGSHPDVRLYGPMAKTKGATEKIYIEQMRTLQQEISLCSMEGRKKIFIIDQADRLVDQAANALLKTLEEPPGDSLLILVTAYPDILPRTILSRCRMVKFRPLSQDSLTRILIQKKGLAEDQAALMARFSQGSVGDFERCDEKGIISRRDRFLGWMKQGGNGQIRSVFEVAEQITGNMDETIAFMEFLLQWTRDLIAMKVRGEEGSLIHADKVMELKEENKGRNLTELLNNAEIIEASLNKLLRNMNQRLVVEDAMVRME